VLGVIAAPSLGRRWTTTGGAHTAHGSSPVSTVDDLSRAVVGITGTRGTRQPFDASGFVRRLHDTAYRIRMHGAMSLDLAGVAEGWLDACVCLNPKPWDVSAGIALVRERGGIVLGRHGGPFTWDSPVLVAGGRKAVAARLIGKWQEASCESLEPHEPPAPFEAR
jgi:fructose-1,6-bisphosphatase/inositol monophosphatase family enzyme